MKIYEFNKSDIFIYPMTMDDMKLIFEDNQDYHLEIEITSRQEVPKTFHNMTDYIIHTNTGYDNIIFGTISIRYQSYNITLNRIGNFRYKTFYTDFNEEIKESIRRATVEIIKKEYANKLLELI